MGNIICIEYYAMKYYKYKNEDNTIKKVRTKKKIEYECKYDNHTSSLFYNICKSLYPSFFSWSKYCYESSCPDFLYIVPI